MEQGGACVRVCVCACVCVCARVCVCDTSSRSNVVMLHLVQGCHSEMKLELPEWNCVALQDKVQQ